MLEIDDKRQLNIKKAYVQELIRLCEENVYILEMLCRIKIALGIVNCGKDKGKEKRILEQQLEIFQIEGDLSEREKEKFTDIYRQLDSHDYGKLLEYIIQKRGPYNLEREQVNYSLESKVYHEAIKSNHNFDIIFYLKKSKKIKRTGHIIIEDEAEFHECKNNIANWLPDDKERLFSEKTFKKAAKKLEFIKNVHMLFENGRIYIPTFAYNTIGKQNCLNDWGYDFIKVLSVNDLIALFEK